MLIELKNNDEKLVVKDMLDIDFDMSVEKRNNMYVINVNRQYHYFKEFDNEKDAEEKMLEIAGCRNNLENELKNY